MTTQADAPSSRLGTNWTAWAVLIFFGVVWGATFSLMKVATDSGAHPLGLSLWNAFLGAAGLIIINLMRRRPIPLAPRYLKFYAICSFLGTTIPGTSYYYAAVKLPAGVLAIAVAIVPMFTFIAAALIGIERWSALRAVGVVLGIIAVGLIVLPETALPDPESAPWMAAALLATACYTAENIYLTLRRPAEVDPFTLLIGMFTIATIVLTPVVYFADGFVPFNWPLGHVEWAIIAMTVINAAAYGGFIYLISAAGPVFASQMGYLVTLSGVGWGILIFSEVHSAWIWAALAIMITGLSLVQPREEISSRSDAES